jgi:preprotein translocase subunit SecB
MSDPNPLANGADTSETVQAQVNVQKIYVKDASFEAPSAPHIFQEQGQPQIQLNLNQVVNTLAEGVYEVVLAITVTCKIGEKNAYLAEVKQAGVFALTGLDQANLHGVLGTFCPNTLFPYARQAISELVLAGGFPPFLLQPINFEQLYVEQMRRRSAEAQAPATTQ